MFQQMFLYHDYRLILYVSIKQQPAIWAPNTTFGPVNCTEIDYTEQNSFVKN